MRVLFTELSTQHGTNTVGFPIKPGTFIILFLLPKTAGKNEFSQGLASALDSELKKLRQSGNHGGIANGTYNDATSL